MMLIRNFDLAKERVLYVFFFQNGIVFGSVGICGRGILRVGKKEKSRLLVYFGLEPFAFPILKSTKKGLKPLIVAQIMYLCKIIGLYQISRFG